MHEAAGRHHRHWTSSLSWQRALALARTRDRDRDSDWGPRPGLFAEETSWRQRHRWLEKATMTICSWGKSRSRSCSCCCCCNRGMHHRGAQLKLEEMEMEMEPPVTARGHPLALPCLDDASLARGAEFSCEPLFKDMAKYSCSCVQVGPTTQIL